MKSWKEENSLKEYVVKNPGKHIIDPLIMQMNAAFNKLQHSIDNVNKWSEQVQPNVGGVDDIDSSMFEAKKSCRDLIEVLTVLWKKVD